MTNNHFKQLLPLLLIIFIDSMGYFIVIPILIRLLSPESQLLTAAVSENTRHLLFGLTLAVMPLTAILSRPIIGYCSDRWGRKNILSLCLLGSAIGFLLPVLGFAIGSMLSILSGIILGRFINGVSASSQAIAQAAISDLTQGKRKAFFLSINALCMTLAMAGGGALGGILSDNSIVSWLNDSTPFLAATALVILALALLQKYFPANTKSKSTTKTNLLTTLKKLITAPEAKNIRILLSIFFLLELSWSLYYQAAPLTFSTHYHIDATTIGLFMGYAGLWMCIGLGVIYAGLIRFTELSHTLIICMVLCTAGTILCGYLPEFSQQWIVAIPIVLGVGMAYPTLLTLMSNAAKKNQQGSLMGLAGAALALAWLITGLISGALVNIFPSLPLHMSGWIMVLALVITLRWKNYYH